MLIIEQDRFACKVANKSTYFNETYTKMCHADVLAAQMLHANKIIPWIEKVFLVPLNQCKIGGWQEVTSVNHRLTERKLNCANYIDYKYQK